MSSIAAFLGAADRAARSEDGPGLAELLRLDKSSLPGSGRLVAELLGASISDRVAAVFSPASPDESRKLWHGVLSEHLAAAADAARGAGSEDSAYTHAHSALSSLLLLVREAATNWMTQPLHVLIRDVLLLSRDMERRLAARGLKPDATARINELTTTLRDAFSYTINHKLPRERIAQSKKWGALLIVNVLFRLYFKLNQMRQCRFFINAVEGKSFPPLSEFPRAQVVTYRYYTGKLAMYEDRFGVANAALSAALEQCHRSYAFNRRRILEALIPVRLHLGELPTDALLERHGLARYYSGIVRAMRTGNVAVFNGAMEEHREYFIREGVYLLLERLQMHVYRTLFKRVARILGKAQLPLPTLLTALGACGVTMDLTELECIVANLIFGRYIRGYLSHVPPVLVTAKTGAFPKLTEVMKLQESMGGLAGDQHHHHGASAGGE